MSGGSVAVGGKGVGGTAVGVGVQVGGRLAALVSNGTTDPAGASVGSGVESVAAA